VFIHPLASELSKVGLPDAGVDEVRRNIALNALEPGVSGNHVLDLRDQIRGLVVPQGLVLVFMPPVVGRGAPHHEGRIDLQVIGLPLLLFEEPPEVLETHLFRHPGLARHHMEADLERRVPQPPVGVDRRLCAVAAVHIPVDPLVGRLDADLDFRSAEIEHSIDLLGIAPVVGLRLERRPDVADVRGLVFRDDVLEVLPLVFVGILGEANPLCRLGLLCRHRNRSSPRAHA